MNSVDSLFAIRSLYRWKVFRGPGGQNKALEGTGADPFQRKWFREVVVCQPAEGVSLFSPGMQSTRGAGARSASENDLQENHAWSIPQFHAFYHPDQQGNDGSDQHVEQGEGPAEGQRVGIP